MPVYPGALISLLHSKSLRGWHILVCGVNIPACLRVSPLTFLWARIPARQPRFVKRWSHRVRKDPFMLFGGIVAAPSTRGYCFVSLEAQMSYKGLGHSVRHRSAVFGVIAILTIVAAGREKILYGFAGDEDGEYADTGLVIDSAGNIYGTTITAHDSRQQGAKK